MCWSFCEPNREAASSRPIKRTSLRSYKLKKLQEEEDWETKETNSLKTEENRERKRELLGAQEAEGFLLAAVRVVARRGVEISRRRRQGHRHGWQLLWWWWWWLLFRSVWLLQRRRIRRRHWRRWRQRWGHLDLSVCVYVREREKQVQAFKRERERKDR